MCKIMKFLMYRFLPGKLGVSAQSLKNQGVVVTG